MLRLIALSLYSLCMLGFCLFGMHRVWLLWLYFQQRNKQFPIHFPRQQGFPVVTIQLPIYNEQYVVHRLIDAVCNIDYPRTHLEIQILDDSTDLTCDISEELARKHQLDGINIQVIRRPHRNGYKAGALQYGLDRSRGDLILILDADFIPPPDILRRGVPYFADPEIGMVQFPWDHINRNYSLLTGAQAVLLDGHFNIEHLARNRSGRFFNFNGTAGIWRKQCILDAGGWQGDTLTEDMDLSYRAQLQGWKFLFVPDLRVPAELPVELNAFKSQQFRWAKGGIQTAIKLLPRLLGAPIPLKVKVEAILHMTANITYLLMPCLILVLPLLVVNLSGMPATIYWLSFVAGFLSILIFYITAQSAYFKQNPYKSLTILPVLMAVGIGLCVNNSRAVLGALFCQNSAFVRTPKYNITRKLDQWHHLKNYRIRIDRYVLIELFFLFYLLWTAALAWMYSAHHLMPFVAIFVFGFFYFIFLTLSQFHLK